MNGFDAIAWLARVGFLVKGVLYMVIGALALQVAAKAGGRVTGTRGALTTVLGQPFGRTLLLVVVVGLLSYATWRILRGLFDPDRLGNNWRGLAIRARFVARGALRGAGLAGIPPIYRAVGRIGNQRAGSRHRGIPVAAR